MDNLIINFRKKMKQEGRSFIWFHKKHLNDVSYVYFMIQLHDEDRMHDSIKKAIEKFMGKNEE